MTMFPPRRRTLLALATTAALAAGATACGTGTTPAKTTAAGGTAKGSVSKDGTEVTTISDEKIQEIGRAHV